MQQDLLIVQLQEGNENAFERIYELYSKSLYGIINSIIHDDKIAEEILQDVFLKIWNSANTYDPAKGRFFTWILNIARNASIDKLRSREYKDKQLDLQNPTFVENLQFHNPDVGKQDAIGIEKYIKALEPMCIKIIDLLFFKGFTQKESAENLQIPLGTLKTRNRACIKKLRSVITQ